MIRKKIKWVSWDKIIPSKEKGALSMGALQDLNLALMAKWWWRYKLDSTSLWSQVITKIHNLAEKLVDYL